MKETKTPKYVVHPKPGVTSTKRSHPATYVFIKMLQYMVNMFTVISFPFMDSSISGGKSEVTSNKNRGTVY